MDTCGSASGSFGPDLERLLSARFGHERFRCGQREIVEAVLAGRDTLAVLPTGGGKSLTYQLPPLVTGRCSLVVSPLVSLMRDQVAAARRRGVLAAGIDSTMPTSDRHLVLRELLAGRIEVMYTSPEGLPRLGRELRDGASFGLFAVDEAHCVSQWGRDFRPDYLHLPAARALLAPNAPVLAVTATATPGVRGDIAAALGMAEPFVHVGTFFRPNLHLTAWRKDGARDAREAIAALLRAHGEDPAIVYRTSRAGAAALAGWLRRHGTSAETYHAGLDAGDRARVQDAFLSGGCRVVVATVAFGMGVDKADVRLVVHADLPASMEAYAQEIGRAGRDGRASDCVLMYSWSDLRRRRALLAGASPESARLAEAAVREVYRFAAGSSCRQRALCAHFGERVRVPCGACDVCGAVSTTRLLRAGGW